MIDPAFERIEVFTRWVGFADPPSHVAKLHITRSGNCFLREQLPHGQNDEAPTDSVYRFLAAVNRPPVLQFNPALFPLPEAVIRSHYDSMWTDDNAAHLVRITFSTGHFITIRAEAQHAFMLPLKVNNSLTNTSLETFDPLLSQAIAALMPDGYLEKERLNGHLGMLEWDLQEHARRTDQSSEAAKIIRQGRAASETPMRVEDRQEALRNDLVQLLFGEERPEEKAEAESTGKLSERLLKRISLQDARELLAKGANPSIADDVGQTALMHAAWPPFDRDKFRLLVQAGADLEARRNDGYTGVHLACASGESEAADEWVQAGADIHARTPEGATPLMLGATWSDIVRVLLAAGADVNAVDQDGHSALVYAILKQSWLQAERQLEAMRTLIDAGADVDRRDHEGVTALGHARRAVVRVRLEEEVIQAFHEGAGLALGLDRRERRMAEAVVNVIASAGGRE